MLRARASSAGHSRVPFFRRPAETWNPFRSSLKFTRNALQAKKCNADKGSSVHYVPIIIAARTRNTKQHLRFQIEFLKLLYHQHFMLPQRTAWKPHAYQSDTVCNPAEADLQLLCNCLLGACLALGCQVLSVPGWSTIRGNRPYLTEAPRPYTPNSQSTPQPGRQQVCCPCTDIRRRFAFRHGTGTTGL